jgi:hypothetical protein
MIKNIGELRNKLHKGLVQEGTCQNSVNGNSSHGVLQLNEIFFGRGSIVASICCETGLLLREDHNTIVPYQKIPTDDLIDIYEYVVIEKKYSFTLNAELV